jgi:hypothetical protein
MSFKCPITTTFIWHHAITGASSLRSRQTIPFKSASNYLIILRSAASSRS